MAAHRRAAASVLHGDRAPAPFPARVRRAPAETGITRKASEYRNLKNGRFSFVDHTYFPPDWTPEAVSAAGTAAWSSPDVLRDPATGAWSGSFADLEIAGYHNPATGEVLTYFPVQH
ncbi:EndoU domain-containing protein [Amycolatopsis carbonis]|uniref:EndoU domain-containing protein n=1 Tax=Amycolatopsis carbonis TaxID=715471 RepID=A0A9Y2IP66_9PSEU|nr:EndoU domain-containing protein [Amycolatopsis sp. 2-15]WIX83960.1 EndoU domain-containing protein [Amycolatopsis sp. 2-15]